MLAGGMMMRRLGWSRVATAVECFGIASGLAWSSFLVLTPLASISAPFADPLLDRADRALGFDFILYAEAVRPWIAILAHSYKSYNWQPVLIVVFLCWTGRTTRCWKFITAGALALVVTAMIFPFFPAEGPFVYYGIPEYGPVRAPWQFGPILQSLKDGVRHLDYTLKTGLVSIPSYHTAAACIFVWATWPTMLRWGLVPLNILLLLGTFVIGSHYLIDILAGAVVAILVIIVTNKVLGPERASNEASHEPGAGDRGNGAAGED